MRMAWTSVIDLLHSDLLPLIPTCSPAFQLLSHLLPTLTPFNYTLSRSNYSPAFQLLSCVPTTHPRSVYSPASTYSPSFKLLVPNEPIVPYPSNLFPFVQMYSPIFKPLPLTPTYHTSFKVSNTRSNLSFQHTPHSFQLSLLPFN